MRAIVFVDYWNLQLTVQQEDGRCAGLEGPALAAHRFSIDWFGLGPALTRLTALYASAGQVMHLSHQQTRIYTSSDPGNDSYKHFAQQVLGARDDIEVFCQDRRPRRNRACPHCCIAMDTCPTCCTPLEVHQEKGVDTLLVTDLLCLGLAGEYDLAILVSQDSDMAPATQHLSSQGIKVIQVGLKHYGNHLARHCWAAFDLFPLRGEIQRSLGAVAPLD